MTLYDELQARGLLAQLTDENGTAVQLRGISIQQRQDGGELFFSERGVCPVGKVMQGFIRRAF